MQYEEGAPLSELCACLARAAGEMGKGSLQAAPVRRGLCFANPAISLREAIISRIDTKRPDRSGEWREKLIPPPVA